MTEAAVAVFQDFLESRVGGKGTFVSVVSIEDAANHDECSLSFSST